MRLIVLLVVLLFIGGCGGVWMNAEYSRLLDETAALSAETAHRADTGELNCDEAIRALQLQSDRWQEFQDARDGRKAGD